MPPARCFSHLLVPLRVHGDPLQRTLFRRAYFILPGGTRLRRAPSIRGGLSDTGVRWRGIGMQERHGDEADNCQINQPLTLLLLSDGSTVRLALSHIAESLRGLTSATGEEKKIHAKTSGESSFETAQSTCSFPGIQTTEKKKKKKQPPLHCAQKICRRQRH